jgi:hypothetical protein
MENKLKRVYQVVDENGYYRSIVTSNGEIIDFASKEEKDAVVYTYDEVRKAIRYYVNELDIPVTIETKNISKGKLC